MYNLTDIEYPFMMSKWTKQIRVKIENDIEGPLKDGYSWRKYGHKDILNLLCKTPHDFGVESYRMPITRLRWLGLGFRSSRMHGNSVAGSTLILKRLVWPHRGTIVFLIGSFTRIELVEGRGWGECVGERGRDGYELYNNPTSVILRKALMRSMHHVGFVDTEDMNLTSGKRILKQQVSRGAQSVTSHLVIFEILCTHHHVIVARSLPPSCYRGMSSTTITPPLHEVPRPLLHIIVSSAHPHRPSVAVEPSPSLHTSLHPC
ncbi:hypothetical protein JHK86_016118 [Glycine max]|nr:hypothetical protein JHK86_016118 [Glycine max]